MGHVTPEEEAAIKRVEDRRNYRVMNAMSRNPTFMNFMVQFFTGFAKYAQDNNLKFSQVGIDDTDFKNTFMSADGKTIRLKPCVTTKNDPEPKILLPGKDF